MAELEVITHDGQMFGMCNIQPDVGDLIRDILAGRFNTVNMSSHGSAYQILVRDIREITIRP